MVIIPRDKPIIENLNIYYLNVHKLLEHYQGEIGSGGIYFQGHSEEGVIYFDKDELLSATFRNKSSELFGADAMERLMSAGGQNNYSVHIYQIALDEIYFWSSIPSAEKIYQDLSTEFTDLEGLIRKMSSEKLTGYIDVVLGNRQEGGLIFMINGKIMGGSFAGGDGEPGPNRKSQELLIQNTKKHGGSFNVCRIPVSKLKSEADSQLTYAKPSKRTLVMLEELLSVFEETVIAKKKMKANFTKLLKKKFVQNAEKYAFLDPFAGELEYSEQQLQFSGNATDQDLIDGITESLRQLIQELGLVSQFTENSAAWSQKYSKQLEDFNIKLT